MSQDDVDGEQTGVGKSPSEGARVSPNMHFGQQIHTGDRQRQCQEVPSGSTPCKRQDDWPDELNGSHRAER
jgi:hypothetical protein